ncbi:MAG: ABC transporter transmembrane domain-containing protein [Betaproteobacteria bacterium]
MRPLLLPHALGPPRRGLLALLVANGIAQALGVAAAAWASHRAFDAWILGRDAPLPAASIGLILFAAFLLIATLRMHERIVGERLGQSYVHAVRLTLFDRLGRLAPRSIERRSRGGHLLRFIGDLTSLRQWMSLGLARLVVASVSIAILLPALALISPFVAALALPVLVAGAVTSFALAPRVRAAVRESRRRRARLASAAEETVSAMATMQAFGQLRRERDRFAHRSWGLARAMIRRARIVGALRAAAEMTGGLASLAILLGGALGVRLGAATPGAAVAAMAVLGLCLPMLRNLSRVQEYWQGYAVSRENLRRFLAESQGRASLARGLQKLRCEQGEVRIEELHAAGALAGVTATAPAGRRVAVVGGHAGGKSTLLAVIARLVDADAGRVRIDGMDIADCRLTTVRAAVALVAPELPLLRGTLEHNLRYRCPDASREDLERVMKLTGLERIVGGLPLGLATRVSGGGTSLSAGERQLVGLARALLGKPRILLLDAVDAQLDAHAAAVFDHVVETFQGTVLMVTRDLARARRADWVWHLEGGRLVGEGTPARLLRDGQPACGVLRSNELRAVA